MESIWAKKAKELMTIKPGTDLHREYLHQQCNEILEHLRCGCRRHNASYAFIRYNLREWRDGFLWNYNKGKGK